MQQSQQNGDSHFTQPALPTAQAINDDPREQQRWQASPREEDEAEAEYADGYAGLDPWDMRNRDDEKIRPRTTAGRGFAGLWLLIAILGALVVAGIVISILISWLILTLVALLVIVGLGALFWKRRVVAFPISMQTFQVAEHPRLLLNNAVGNVVVRRGEEGLVTVTGTKRASGIRVSPQRMQVGYDLRGNTLAVSARVNWHLLQFGMNRIDLEISVPTSCDLRLENGSGNVVLQGINGEIKLRTGSGRIDASQLQGRMTLKTGSGAISVAGASGQVTLATGSGRIDASATLLAGASQFKTGSGSISFEGTLDPRGKNEFVTGSGPVACTLPQRAAFSLKATTGSGRVVNEFGACEVGSKPRAQLRVKTGSGGICLYRRSTEPT
jgi:Putative adhesin